MNVETKDLERMSALIKKNSNGASIAKSIKDKDKAVRRYVAGLFIIGSRLSNEQYNNKNFGFFSPFAERAIQLGATFADFNKYTCSTTIDITQSQQKASDCNIKYVKDRIKQMSEGEIIGLIDSTLDEISEDLYNMYSHECRKRGLDEYGFRSPKRCINLLINILKDDECNFSWLITWLK